MGRGINDVARDLSASLAPGLRVSLSVGGGREAIREPTYGDEPSSPLPLTVRARRDPIRCVVSTHGMRRLLVLYDTPDLMFEATIGGCAIGGVPLLPWRRSPHRR